MKKILLLIFLFILVSCTDELITVVDEYNSPYNIKSIPGDGKASISFVSGVLSSDFAGFNLYVGETSEFTQPSSAILGPNKTLPTIGYKTHTRSNMTIEIPYTFKNNTKYFVTVTAYGTNDLLEDRYLETKISKVVEVVPRPEGTGAGNIITINSSTIIAKIAEGLITPEEGWTIQYLGFQTNFNDIIIITNINSFDNNAPYVAGGLYVLKSGNQLAKIWIKDNANNYQWSYNKDLTLWNGL